MDIERIKEDLKDLGYAVIDPLLDSEQLENLRTECEILREVAIGTGPSSAWGSDARSSCIFETLPGHICAQNPPLRSSFDVYKSSRSTWPLQSSNWNLLFNSHLTSLVSALLGPSAVLFNEQYIVKPSRAGDAASFAWHRDSDWCRDGAIPQPYISVWVALDDMTENNGCMVIRPQSHATSPDFVHLPGLAPLRIEAPEALDAAELMALPLCFRAGAAVITTDVVEHCSGPNRSQYARRAWMPQFSMAPIVWKESGQPVSLAIPLLKDQT